MFYNEIFPWYISVTTHVLDFRIGTQSRKKETEEEQSSHKTVFAKVP